MLKKVQECKVSQLGLVGDSQLASRQIQHTSETYEKMNSRTSWSTTGQKVQPSRSVSSWLELATQPSHEVKQPISFVLKNLTLRIRISP
nr:hypothetical protein CFP56_17796 [Quercus suber]